MLMSLYANINKRKKAGTSRPKSKSTISSKAYANMKAGFHKIPRKKGGLLTKRQQDTLKKHPKHHTAKHMSFMRKEMKAGKTFTVAHKAAMKKVGK